MGRSPAARARRNSMKRRCVPADTPLARWLATQSIGVVTAAVGLTRMAVYGWLWGHSLPRPEHARILVTLSAGALTMDTIYPATHKES